MKCLKCGSLRDKVLDSRETRDGAAIRRRRECLECGYRFTTYEEIGLDEVLVAKRDGRREPFVRAKLERGIRAACAKRPVTEEQIRRLVDSVVASFDAPEISSERIGEIVMDGLLPLDEVACIRFASVYRSFSDINQFLSAIAETAKKRTAK